jgi:sugar phosphate isomerase/epimerase
MTRPTQTTTEMLWAVFTKPWPMHTARELSEVIVEMGFNAAEIPVRANTFITPENAESLLPDYIAELTANGVTTISIAADLSEGVFSASRKAGVPLIRTMVEVTNNDYASSIKAARQQLGTAARWARDHDVGIVIQPHHGRYVSSCMGVLELIADFPPEHFKVVWDAAHDALAGDDPITTLNACGDRLAVANFKNVVYAADPPAGSKSETTGWKPWFVPGPDGLANWRRALDHLRLQEKTVPLCFTAQYSSDAEPADVLVKRDLSFAQKIWNGDVEQSIPTESHNTP